MANASAAHHRAPVSSLLAGHSAPSDRASARGSVALKAKAQKKDQLEHKTAGSVAANAAAHAEGDAGQTDDGPWQPRTARARTARAGAGDAPRPTLHGAGTALPPATA